MTVPKLAIVGGGSLMGREIRDVLAERAFPKQVALVGADDEDAGALTEQDGELVVMTALDQDALRGVKVAFLAGSQSSSRRASEVAAGYEPAPALVDLTHALEDRPSSRLRAPLVEPPGYLAPPGAIHSVAHPAAAALALCFLAIQARHKAVRSVAHVFEPASERGRRGLDELQKQTVNLLSFQKLPQAVFDAQLGFNMLARYGSEAPTRLEDVELLVERHLATLLANRAAMPMPSLRLVQAPVFHGHSFSVWIEFEGAVSAGALADTLRTAGLDVRDGELEPPTNVGIAGQSGVAVGAISPDRNNPRACWLWMVADNLRLAAEDAVTIAAGLLED